eukprot:2326700-Pleurochrysis_carterae.AAC.1
MADLERTTPSLPKRNTHTRRRQILWSDNGPAVRGGHNALRPDLVRSLVFRTHAQPPHLGDRGAVAVRHREACRKELCPESAAFATRCQSS